MNILLVAGGVLANPAALLRKITPANYDCIIAVDHGYDHCATLGLKPDILMGDLDSLEAVPHAQGSANPCGTENPSPTHPPNEPHCRGGVRPPALHTQTDTAVHCAPAAPTLQIIPFAPEKDDTDLRLATKHALALGADEIDIVCATGGRLDQFMGNLSLLEFLQAEAPHLPARMIDEGNVIQLLVAEENAENTTANAAQGKAEGEAAHQAPTKYPRRSKYISLIPVSESICFSGQGLKYPAQQLTVQRSNMISISNEAVGDAYSITLHSGKALLIEAD